MNRYHESKIAEHDGRLDKISREIDDLRKEKESDYDMTKLSTVAIEFEKEKYKIGEAKVNRNLTHGLVIQKWFQTESGVVIFMAKWKKK